VPLRHPGDAALRGDPEARGKWLRHYSSGANIHNRYSSFLTSGMEGEWGRIREEEPHRGTKDEFDDFAASWARVKADAKGFRARFPERSRFIDAVKGMSISRKVRSLRIERPR
jgi:hypothetical protein